MKCNIPVIFLHSIRMNKILLKDNNIQSMQKVFYF